MKRTAFTLIELLVVISIIASLSSIILTNIYTARAKARDARRISDVQQLSSALEMYFNDNGFYPKITVWAGTSPGCLENFSTKRDALRDALVPKYIPAIPRDPLPHQPYTDFCYLYASDSDGKAFKLMIYNTMETKSYSSTHQNSRYYQCPTGGPDQATYSIVRGDKSVNLYGSTNITCG